MDKAYIDRENVVERYVQGRLAPSERSDFEIYMLEHPETAEDVEYARGLEDGLRKAHDEFFVTGTSSAARGMPFWQTPQYATAAAIALVSFTLATAWLFQRGTLLNDEIERLRQPASVTHEVWLETLRGAGDTLIERGANESVLLRAIVDTGVPGPYRVEIHDAEDTAVWSQSNVPADEEPSVAVFARDLPYGRYRLIVTAQSGAQVAADHAFRLAPVAGPVRTQ